MANIYEDLMKLSGGTIATFSFWGVPFQATFQLAPAEQNAMFAGLANQSNISSKPHHFPLESPTGVFLAQRHFISNLHIRQHSGIITLTCYNPAIAKGYPSGLWSTYEF